MRQIYIRELSSYTPRDLSNMLDISEDAAYLCIEKLSAQGVLKLRSNNDESEYDPADTRPIRGSYQFVYVGLALFRDFCLVVYPKYMPIVKPDEPGRRIKQAMRQIFRVLRLSSGSYSQVATLSEEGTRDKDRLPLMLALLESYEEYGVYSNYVRTIEDNGAGDINWERTIASNLPVISNGTPLYLDYKTNKSNPDSSDFVTKLHRSVLTECSRFFQDSGMAELLGLGEISLSNKKVDEYGEAGYLIYMLERERGTQFVTWKQDVMDMLLRYIGECDSLTYADEAICLGTSSFYHVWEMACKVAFGDALAERLGNLGMDLSPYWEERNAETLLSIIPKPLWTAITKNGEYDCGGASTLIPDIVLPTHSASGKSIFAILDAKYYTPALGNEMKGLPGIEAIAKQFLYQSAYRNFIVDQGFDAVVHAFVAPTADDDIQHVGRVRLPSLMPEEETPLSNTVELYKLPAQKVFDAYLAGTRLDAASLFSIIE